jgi:hypothetical protein
MAANEYLEFFRHSYAQMGDFNSKWLTSIGNQCTGDPQRQAAFYAWSRYAMSIRTLDRLLDPAVLPDVYVICRGCLEFDVTMEAAMKGREYADKYLEYVYAIAVYLKLVKRQGDTKKFDELKAEFILRFNCDPETFSNRRSWCDDFGGMTGLMSERWLNRPNHDIRGYKLLSHYAHGSVLAMNALGNIENPLLALAGQIRWAYGHYLESTRNLLDYIWQAADAVDGTECKSDLKRIYIEHGTHPATKFLLKSDAEVGAPTDGE